MKTSTVLIFVFAFCHLSLAQYYPVPNSKTDLSSFFNRNEPFITDVDEFSISNLITVAEFKNYLLAVERDSSNQFYENQLPKLGNRSMEWLTAILKDPKLEHEPMPGISWSVARNYCKWLTAQAAKKELNYTYELPQLFELVAYENAYGKMKNPVLETWTLNMYDESMMDFVTANKLSILLYDAKPEDPPAMKRKYIFGGSFRMNYGNKEKPYLEMYEYQDSSSRFVGFRVVRKSIYPLSNPEKIKKSVEGNGVEVSIFNNHLSGVYCERYPDGKTKVLGEFYDGHRTGVWSVWDTSGTLNIQRNYLETKAVDYLFPEVENPYAELYEKYMPTHLVRNAKGYFPYTYLEERAVYYSFRSWRELNSSNEPDLFLQVDFKTFLTTALKAEAKLFEYGKWAEFNVQVSNEKYPELLIQSEHWDFSRIEIKEDFFYNSDTQKSDVRQVGMSFYEKAGDKVPKYSLYFPKMRDLSATFPVKINGNPEIKNLDDYFFFKAYRGTIVYYSNPVMERDPKMSEKDWEIELWTIVAEHSIWQDFNR